MGIGEKLVNAIIEGRLLTATCPDSPGSSCVIVWSANVCEQLTQLVKDHAEPQESVDAGD